MAEQWGAVMEDEVAIRVHGVFPLPMGMEREDRHESELVYILGRGPRRQNPI